MRKFIYNLLLIKKFFYFLLYPFILKGGRLNLTIRRNIENYIIFQPSRLRAVKIRRELLKHICVQRFLSTDRVKLFAWFIKPQENKPVFLFFHGQAESILSHQDIASFCIKYGFGLFLLSYRGHYKSGGQPTEKGTFLDAQAAIKQLKKLGVDEDKIILWGHSYGTAVATETALKNSNLKAIILQSSITDYKTAFKNVINFTLTRYKIKYLLPFFVKKIDNSSFITKLDNISKIKDISIPLLILHSRPDCVSPYTNALELAKRNDKAKLIITEKGSHWSSRWCFDHVFEFANTLEYNERGLELEKE